MDIKITRNVICDGKSVKKGDIVDATESSARFLIKTGKAVIAEPDLEKDNVEPDSRVAESPKRNIGKSKSS